MQYHFASASFLALLLTTWSASAAPSDSPPDSQPDEDSVVRPSTRPFVVSVGLGPSLGIVGCSDSGCDSASRFNQFKLTQDFGYHFFGEGEGPALGFSIEEAFGDNVLRIQPGLKFWWDIQAVEDVGFYIAPFIKAGYTYFSVDLGPFGEFSDHAFNPQAGLALHLALADRGQLVLRPVVIDMFINDDGVGVTYDIMAGGGVTF
jgi:hypothetical protein